MPIGIATAVATGVGALAGGISSYWQAREQNRAMAKRNKQIQENLVEIRKEREKSISRQKSTAQEFLNQYAMIRDPRKSQAIQQMFLQSQQAGERERQSLDAQSRELKLAKGAETDVGLATIAGAVGGGLQLGAGLAGQEFSTESPTTLSTNTTEGSPNQISNVNRPEPIGFLGGLEDDDIYNINADNFIDNPDFQ